MKPKVAFVVQRYGQEVNGGAEVHCRQIVELMRDEWDIEVLTTCAKEYMTWKNDYAKGMETRKGYTIRRFPVRKPRNLKVFNRISERIFFRPHSIEDEQEWMNAQGPEAPDLQNYIECHQNRFHLFVFFTYLYATTFRGLPVVSDKALLVPTAHDEPPIYLSIYRDFFSSVKCFAFNTIEEKRFLQKLFPIDSTISDVIGTGVDIRKFQKTAAHLPSRIASQPYVTYIGRVDPSKGCRTLLTYWRRFKQNNPSPLRLVLVGGLQMKIPSQKDVVSLGFVSEEEKIAVLQSSRCLIMPSPFESLSIVLLESWGCGIPVLVNGGCNVLKGQVTRGNGGLWYENYEEFEACLNYLLQQTEDARKMARSGKQYTLDNYSFPLIKQKYQKLSRKIMALRG